MGLDKRIDEGEIRFRQANIAGKQCVDTIRAERERRDLVVQLADAEGRVLPSLRAGFDDFGGSGGDPADADAGKGVGFGGGAGDDGFCVGYGED